MHATEHAGIPSRVGDALMPLLGLGHHEFPVHFRDVGIESGVDGDAVQPFDLVVLALVIRRRESGPRLEYAHLGRVLEPLREQGDDGRVHIVDGLPERLDLGHGDRGLRIMPCGVGVDDGFGSAASHLAG